MTTRIEYNGIVLEAIGTVDVQFENKEDGNNYIFTRATVTAICWYSPAVTAYAGGNPDTDAKPFIAPGVHAPLTAKSLIHFLGQPRKKFKYVVGDDVVIESPKAGEFTDATNGPYLKAEVLEEIHGERTFKVRVTIKTDLNLCTAYLTDDGKKSPVISHRWSMSEGIEDGAKIVSRMIRGRVYFHAGRLVGGLQPDDFRKFLILPPGRRWRREKVETTVLEGDEDNPPSIEYIAYDTRQRTALLQDGITDVQFKQHMAQRHPSVDAAVSGFTTLSSMLKGKSSLQTIGSVLGANVPLRIFTFHLTVQGNPETPMSHIKLVAYQALANRINILSGQAGAAAPLAPQFGNPGRFSLEMEEDQEPRKGTIDITFSFIESLAGIAAQVAAGALPILPTFKQVMASVQVASKSENEVSAATADYDGFDTTANVFPKEGGEMPWESGTRRRIDQNTSIIFTQALRDACNPELKPSQQERRPSDKAFDPHRGNL